MDRELSFLPPAPFLSHPVLPLCHVTNPSRFHPPLLSFSHCTLLHQPPTLHPSLSLLLLRLELSSSDHPRSERKLTCLFLCCSKNRDTPLDCWREAEDFKAAVAKLEQVSAQLISLERRRREEAAKEKIQPSSASSFPPLSSLRSSSDDARSTE